MRVVKALLAGAIAGVLIAPGMARAAPAYDPTPWLHDLDQARDAIATKYANLEWVVREREVDLTALFADTQGRIRGAVDAAAARAAFDRLARRLGDGHVRFRWPAGRPRSGATRADCGELGFDARMLGAPVAALVPGYQPLADAPAHEFAAGTIEVAGHRVGVMKIGIFTPQGLPELCAAGLAALEIRAASPCDDACAERILDWASQRMTRDLEAQIEALKAAGAELLLVDVANNGGGTEWAEAAARMLTGARLHSERLGFVRGRHWSEALARKEAELRAAERTAADEDRTLLDGLADQLAAARREAESACDSSPLWRGAPPACRWLGGGLYASGPLAVADPDRLRGRPWARQAFTPMQFTYREGVWRGPLIVLVDGGTGSAAEEFAAILQDNRAALVIGAPTAGAGCGHTNGGTPTTLTNSGAVLELPDCARLRADGSNEVMGIQPDILIGLRDADGPHRKAVRVAEKLPEAVTRAMAGPH